MLLEDIGLIGNCQYSALIENSGSVVWSCLPRFDSEPVFSAILDSKEGGRFTICPAGGGQGNQRYVDNTNILITTFATASGSFRIIDFAPRFQQFSRMYRPTMLIRIVEVIDGAPKIIVSCDPRIGWTKGTPELMQGSNHIEFAGFTGRLRLTTDIPISYLQGRRPFSITGKRHLVLTWGQPVEEPLPGLCDRFLNETAAYWQRWVKHCTIPPDYQNDVIRSALALKLHCYEDTGAIVASMTTSIPESSGSGRTWDYRYCWLRDAFYALNAFRLLGHFEERERFTYYLLNIIGGAPDLKLSPLYRVDGSCDLKEETLPNWPGFNGDGPVRTGNDAALHVQNDVFGEMVLALAPIFVDERFSAERTASTFKIIERLSDKAVSVAGLPDTSIWEYRDGQRVHTFSSLMCWAAADRMARISERHGGNRTAQFRSSAAKIKEEIIKNAWDKNLMSFTGSYGGGDLDSSLLQIASLRFLDPSDGMLASTIDSIRRGLANNGWLLRYRRDDGLGTPSASFIICTFWLVEALAIIGRQDEAKKVMSVLDDLRSPLRLISEDLDSNKRLSGNFPQAYSHVGLIHAAFASSPRWSEVI